MTDAQAALAQVREALEAMRGDWLGDGFTKLRRSQIVAVLDEREAEIKRLRKLAMSTHLFEEAPCFLCGYNGPGYYQPEQHPCAALYHEAMEDSDE